MSKSTSVPGTSVPASSERVWTRPLTVFWIVVAAILAFAARERFKTPSLGEAILLLADGDLDGEERTRLLPILVEGALRSAETRDHWAGLLAAVALGDRLGHAALKATLGPDPVPSILPKPLDRDLLHLGDPMLGNLLRAMIAEHDGQREEARIRWRQVAAQCRLTGRAFGAELAVAALQRLG